MMKTEWPIIIHPWPCDRGYALTAYNPARNTPDSIAEKMRSKSGINFNDGEWFVVSGSEVSTCLGGHVEYHDAWEPDFEKKSVRYSMERARKIHIDKIRKRRDELLQKTDGEYILALSSGDKEAAGKIERYKQSLRDIPETTDLSEAKTIDELILIWPDMNQSKQVESK